MKILAVFEIKDREVQVRALFVDTRYVHDQVALLGQEAGRKVFMFVKLAGAGGGEFGR
jgi:hypothetical protein